jgi:hypothetical protein
MEDNLFNLRKLPATIIAQLGMLMVARLGTDKTSYMIVKDFIGFLSPEKVYKLSSIDISKIDDKLYSDAYKGSQITLVACDDATDPKNKPVNAINRLTSGQKFTPPIHASLHGVWQKQKKIAKNNANILGGCGSFIDAETTELDVPVIMATDEALAFYGAYLVEFGQTVQFESKQELPITLMEVGKTFVDNYLMLEGYGDGEYIEYHNEPHFWMHTSATDDGGHILLGREIDGVYYLTGFKIPPKCGIYAAPYVIHADSFLLGELLVVYTVAAEYSTVILENKKNTPIKINFYSQTT